MKIDRKVTLLSWGGSHIYLDPCEAICEILSLGSPKIGHVGSQGRHQKFNPGDFSVF